MLELTLFLKTVAQVAQTFLGIVWLAAASTGEPTAAVLLGPAGIVSYLLWQPIVRGLTEHTEERQLGRLAQRMRETFPYRSAP